ncbi:MAG: N-acetylmuramoyl-L-alanine amidase [Candidatus Rokubacteria bacterium]|nr:N-acetylmuramoyl-L-alanine amidase [Candidatus Rokubacteria bacterium]
MPPLKRVKYRLITELVRENVETLHGLPPRSLRRTRRVRSGVLRGLGLVVAPSLLFVAISALSTGRGEQPAWAPPAGSSEDVSLPAPRLINPAAFPLTVQKIILDPGHGGKDPGAPTSVGLWEKDITLDVARRLRALLAEASFDVAMTREKDVTVSLRQRAQFANAQRGDLFVSIHFNALPTRDHRGVETYYLGPTSDPDIERLAGAENRESGYSLADFRRLLEGVYVHVRQKESKQFAAFVHRGLTTTLVKGNPAIKDSGVKPAPFLVLVATDMPGILAEVSYLSNDDDARLLREPSYRDKIARALFKGIRAYADGRSQPGGKGSS